MRRPIAWLHMPDPLDDQLAAERADQQTPRGGAATAALASAACLGLLVVLLAATVYGWLASPEMWA